MRNLSKLVQALIQFGVQTEIKNLNNMEFCFTSELELE